MTSSWQGSGPSGSRLSPEVCGALAMFWIGGDGPHRNEVSVAFALAGLVPPRSRFNPQGWILDALLAQEGPAARRLFEELLVALRRSRVLKDDNPALNRLREALARDGHRLTPDGVVLWSSSQETDTDALDQALQRLPGALRPLIEPRHGRPAFEMTDEYAFQDAVEMILRALYEDVRHEERCPSYAGSAGVIDFLIPELALALEIKCTRRRRGARQIKGEIAVDILEYQAHPMVRRLYVLVFDPSREIRNPKGFESDFARVQGLSIDVRVNQTPIHRIPAAS